MDPNTNLSSRIDMIEEKLDLIMDHLGVQQLEEPDEEPPGDMPPRKKMMEQITSAEEK